MSEKKLLDEGLNNLDGSSSESRGFRQLMSPFRRRSNPEKMKSGSETILNFQDKNYVLQNDAERDKESKRVEKKKLKPLQAVSSDSKSNRPTSLFDPNETIPEDQVFINGNSDLDGGTSDLEMQGIMANCLEETIFEEEPSLSPKPKVESMKADAPLEFGGPSGVLMNMITMPLTIYLVNAACNKNQCTVTQLPDLPIHWSSYVNLPSFLIYTAWMGFQIVMHLAIPGRIVAGAPRPNKRTIFYICNGFKVFLLTIGGLTALNWLNLLSVSVIINNVFGIITMASVTSVMLSFFLYFKSFASPNDDLSPLGNTGLSVYDFYMGRELNPHLGPLDLKFFCELRPGLLLWGALDLTYLFHQWQTYGFVDFALAAVVFCHLLYIGDALYFEDAVLTTLDITTEGFGFMLAFGDLTWVPFLFSLHARFLAFHPSSMSVWVVSLFLFLNGIGYWIFRASNNEKDSFRRHPTLSNFKDSEVLSSSSRGLSLLAGGWWGWLRHPNYFGDFLMGLSWSLLCGFDHFLPWMYFIYLSMALLHRTKRDDEKCHKKYNDLWEKYKKMVPHCMIPFIY